MAAAADLADNGRAFRDPSAVHGAQAAAQALVDQARTLAAGGPIGRATHAVGRRRGGHGRSRANTARWTVRPGRLETAR